MKARIRVDAKKALKIGNDQSGNIDIVFDPAALTQEQRDELAMDSDYDGNGQKVFQVPGTAGTADMETMKDLLNKSITLRKERNEKEKQKKLDLITEFMAKKDEECWEIVTFIGGRPRQWDWKSYTYQNYLETYAKDLNHKEALTKIKRIGSVAEAALEKAEAGYKAKKEAEDANREKAKAEKEKQRTAKLEAQAAKLKAQDDQIVEWVRKKGTKSQKNRLAENLLPKDEIVNIIRDESYAELKDISRYEKLKASDICTCDQDCDYSYDYGYCNCEYDVYTKKSATSEEYEQLQKIRKLMPQATIELREHEGTSEKCENTVVRTGYMVRIKVGAFEFSREYGLDNLVNE